MLPHRATIVHSLMLGLLVLLPGPVSAADPQRSSRDSPAIVHTDIVTRQAYCKWAVKPPILDGKLDDKCWEDAAPIEQFASFWLKPPAPRAGMKAYLVWDNQALYYGGTMTDTELRAYGTKRNDTLWDGDVFEMFFKPRVDKPEYYEFQANPKALVFEAAFTGKPLKGTNLTDLPELGNRAVITLNGTLDKPGDKDTGWTVEGRIPWTAFAPTGGKPKPGEEWTFAICRYDYGPDGKPITMSSAPLTEPNFHRTQDYGKLRFDGPKLPVRFKRAVGERRENDR
jgi:Carbohydrate family 9 binding domain-like